MQIALFIVVFLVGFFVNHLIHIRREGEYKDLFDKLLKAKGWRVEEDWNYNRYYSLRALKDSYHTMIEAILIECGRD